MEPDAPLDYMLDHPTGPAAGREELEAIVARSGRRRTRITAAGMAATLAIGAAAGWAVRSGRSTGGTPVATAQRATSTTMAVPPALVAGGGVASTPGGPMPGGPIASPAANFTKKFVRTTGDGVTIRAYQAGTATTTPAVKNVCRASLLPAMMAEVSTSDVVGQVGGGFGVATPAAPFLAVTGSVIGVVESAPVWIVTTRTDATAALVRVTFADGKTDEMAPVDGWSALAHIAPSGRASGGPAVVQALDATGHFLAKAQVPDPLGSPKILPQVPAPPPAAGAPVTTTVPGKIGPPCLVPPALPPAGIPAPKGTPVPATGTAGTAGPASCGC